jgi:hypothetical protein
MPRRIPLPIVPTSRAPWVAEEYIPLAWTRRRSGTRSPVSDERAGSVAAAPIPTSRIEPASHPIEVAR